MAVVLTFDDLENAHKLDSVTNPNPLKSGLKQAYTEDGLYSEKIFGPVKSFTCSCGKLYSKSNAGRRCQHCGVLCDTNTLRSSTMARIDLPKNVYIVLPIFQNILNYMFGQNAIKVLIEGKNYEATKAKPYYYSVQREKLIKANKLKDKEPRVEFPVYDITTLYILYRKMLNSKLANNILKHLADPIIAKYIFVNFILVTPPNSRPLAKLKNKQFQVPPVTAAYTEILKNIKSSFLDKIYSSNADNFGQTVYKYQNSVRKLYEEITSKTFQKKESIVRESLSGKTIETSQRSVIIPEPILYPGDIALSQESMTKMYFADIYHFLETEYQSTNDSADFSITNYVSSVHEKIAPNGDINLTQEEFHKFFTWSTKTNHNLCLIERPPVLYRFNISGAKISMIYPNNGHRGIKQNRVMGVNSSVAAMFNFDFDGDSMSAIALSSKQAKDAFKYSSIESSVEFEHNTNLIASPEHEAIYAAFALSACNKFFTPEPRETIEIESLNDFVVDLDILENYPYNHVYIKDQNCTLKYTEVMINVALNTGKILYRDTLLDKGNLNKLLKLLLQEVGKENFYRYFHNFNKVLLECSTIVSYCNPSFKLTDFAVGSDEITEYKKTLINEPYIAFHQNDILFNELVSPLVKEDHENILGRVFDSGARIKSVQLLKAVSNNGIPTNIYGKAFAENIPNSLLEGLTKKEFFMGGDSARLALAQRQEAIPKGGELQRKFYYCTGFLKLDKNHDCGTTRGMEIKIHNKAHLKSLYSRYLVSGEEIDINDDSLIGQTVVIRTPIYCEHSEYQVCSKCFGHKQPQSSSLGASIGAFLSESIIQSVLRTHHFSGAFITNINKELRSLIKELKFKSPNLVFGDEEKILKLENILKQDRYYGEGNNIEFKKEEDHYKILIHELPFNDDSVKQLNNIVGYIDRNRDSKNLISLSDMYNFLLENIVLPNNILSIYIELVISILYYDELGTMIRYSKLPPDHQIALKNVIDKLDPKLAIFHNFSNKNISRIYTTKVEKDLDHMYFNLINCYH